MSGDNLMWTGTSIPNERYYNLYISYSSTVKGHSLAETEGWYEDYKNMIYQASPWMVRSGGYSDGSSTGVFHFSLSNSYGNANNEVSFRIILINS